MLIYLRIAVRNLLKNRARSLIVGTAIFSVTVLMVLLMGVSAGIKTTILRAGTALFSGHVNIAGFYKISQSSAAPVVNNYKKILTLARANVPEGKIFLNRLKAWGKMISASNSMMVPMWGVNADEEGEVLGALQLASKIDYITDGDGGEDLSQTEGSLGDIGKPGGIVIFAQHAKKLKVRVGDVITVSMPTYRNINNTKDVKVVAVLKDMGLLSSFSTYLGAQDVREIYNMENADTTGQIMVYLNSLKDVAKVEDRLRKLLSANGYLLMEKEAAPFYAKFDRVAGESWVGQKLDITTWYDETAFIKWIIDIFDAITYVLVIILMTIIILGLMNALWISIRERTNEIGTLRAIGMQRRSVLWMFILESFTLAVTATLAGIIVGSLIALIVNLQGIPINSDTFRLFLMSHELQLVIQLRDLLTCFCFITIFSILGAWYPAYKASKMLPITAINQVN